MLLAGYSYGALVTTRLPSLDTILAYFTTPAIHTAEADIRLRAQHLAEAHLNAQSAGPTSPRKSLGVRVEGMRILRAEAVMATRCSSSTAKSGFEKVSGIYYRAHN